MSPQQTEAAIAAFLRTKGATRCPAACVAPTHASIDPSDRAALRRLAERKEARIATQKHPDWWRALGWAA